METMIAFVKLEDLDKINTLPQFKPVYEYINGNEVAPEEWGKIIFDNLEIKLYASSQIRYGFDPQTKEMKSG